jgi:hypothetical protein
LETSLFNKTISSFLLWKDKSGYKSYDQYDFWSTKYGIWSKGLYYKNRKLGAFFVSPIFLAEIFLPVLRKLFVSKKRFPIADAHFLLAYLNLFKKDQNPVYLQEARSVADALLQSSIDGYSGHCWGYPFNWMTTRGLWTSGIPLITTTGYCFEGFLELYKATNEEKYLDIARSIFDFTLNDLKDSEIEENVSSCSYSPIDTSQIINANAYRSMVLVTGGKLFQNEKAVCKAKKNINFILKFQQEDGSWLYAVNDERDHFIDNFHTCFVLKNLIKVNDILNETKISDSIKKGFDFYKKNLLTENYEPKPFAKLSRFNIVKTELYDYAEAISLTIQLQNFDSSASKITEKLVNDLVGKFQKKDGSFYTRISIFNIPNKIPYLRWPQAQLFFALSNYKLTHKNFEK